MIYPKDTMPSVDIGQGPRGIDLPSAKEVQFVTNMFFGSRDCSSTSWASIETL